MHLHMGICLASPGMRLLKDGAIQGGLRKNQARGLQVTVDWLLLLLLEWKIPPDPMHHMILQSARSAPLFHLTVTVACRGGGPASCDRE